MRGMVFGVVYIVGFLGGAGLSRLAGHMYEPSFAVIGSRLGTNGPKVMLGIAAVFMIACWGLRAWGSAYLNADVVWNPDALTDALIVEGPFRYTRSPLYLGNMCMAIGIGALATPAGLAIIVLGSLAFVLVLVQYETRELLSRHGALIKRYVARVPPLLPRLRPLRMMGSSPAAPSLAQGLRSEIFTAALGAGMILLFIFGMGALRECTVLWIAAWVAQQAATWPRE